MPRGGHNKKPDYLKMVQGTKRRDRSNPSAPEVEHFIPEPSESLPKEAQKEYQELAAILSGMKIVAPSDQWELESLALSRAQITHLSSKLFIQSDIKSFRKIQIALNDAIRTSSNLALKFGLSPSDRGRVSTINGNNSNNKFNKWEEIGK